MKIKNLEITTKVGCSNMCNHCPQEMLIREYARISNKRYMTIKTFSECLEKVDTDVNIGFTGFSEPFLNTRTFRMIEIANQRNPVYISTTLEGLNLSDIEFLESINFTQFAVHLPSKTGDNIPTHDAYLEVLRAVIDSDIPNKSYHYHGQELHPRVSFVNAKRAGTHSRAGNIKDIKTKQKSGPVRCVRNFAHPVLLPNGDISLCCMDYGLKHIIGNLLDQSVEEIYSSDKFRSSVEASKRNGGSICHRCSAYGAKA